VRPVVDPGQHETEEDQADDPPHGLPVDGHAKVAAPGFPVVQDRADEPADGG